MALIVLCTPKLAVRRHDTFWAVAHGWDHRPPESHEVRTQRSTRKDGLARRSPESNPPHLGCGTHEDTRRPPGQLAGYMHTCANFSDEKSMWEPPSP